MCSKGHLLAISAWLRYHIDKSLTPPFPVLPNTRLPSVDSDILITVNVPYPDEGSAANSSASAECFTGPQSQNTCMPGEPVGLQASPEGCDGAPVVEVAMDKDAGEECVVDRDVAAEEGGRGREGSEKVLVQPEKVSRDAGGTVEGSGGVDVLQSVLRSFDILDWSLFC